MSTPEDVLRLGEPDPEQTALFEKMGTMPKPNWDDMETVRRPGRERWAAAVKAFGETSPHCVESEIQIPVRDGRTSRAKLLKPTKPATGGSPLVVLLFGGGFVMGFPEQMTIYGRGLARQYGATVLCPDYRLGPEHPFPGAPHDVWDAVTWAGKHAAELGADPSAGFAIGGISAGGNLSAVIGTQYVMAGEQPPLTGLWLSIPLIYVGKDSVPEEYRHLYLSMEQNANTPVLDSHTMTQMRVRFKADPSSPWYVAGRNTDAIPNMPPVYFQACGMDPLRDDALIYETVLRKAGRKTRIDVYPGLVHGGWAFFPTLSASKRANEDIIAGLGWLLGKEQREPKSAERSTGAGEA